MNVPEQGWVVAITTAITESQLKNLPYGDRDSIGLFQQRPSQGWGSVAQIMDPTYSSEQFYRHLLAVPDWQNLTVAVAAQTVQRSGFPDPATQMWGAAALEPPDELRSGVAESGRRERPPVRDGEVHVPEFMAQLPPRALIVSSCGNRRNDISSSDQRAALGRRLARAAGLGRRGRDDRSRQCRDRRGHVGGRPHLRLHLDPA
ncbi:hypothetical protein [Amycolatopsis saalfeldensis]|uniref:hypothetical protein n=1 Tax=Amycolatopsis saalfeldensis TaxID=394193 RepID=UPI000AC99C6E|nr:hypothetical protein [Amycolatopsis saalfeldensis]